MNTPHVWIVEIKERGEGRASWRAYATRYDLRRGLIVEKRDSPGHEFRACKYVRAEVAP